MQSGQSDLNLKYDHSLYWKPLDELKELQRFSLYLGLSLQYPFCLLFSFSDLTKILIHTVCLINVQYKCHCLIFFVMMEENYRRHTVDTQTHFWMILKGWLGFSASSLNIGSERSQAPDVGLLKSVLQYGTEHTGVCGGRITASSPIIYRY